MNKNIFHMRKATVFVDFYDPVNCVFKIFCFGQAVSCVERLDIASNFLPKPALHIYRVHWSFGGYNLNSSKNGKMIKCRGVV